MYNLRSLNLVWFHAHLDGSTTRLALLILPLKMWELCEVQNGISHHGTEPSFSDELGLPGLMGWALPPIHILHGLCVWNSILWLDCRHVWAISLIHCSQPNFGNRWNLPSIMQWHILFCFCTFFDGAELECILWNHYGSWWETYQLSIGFLQTCHVISFPTVLEYIPSNKRSVAVLTRALGMALGSATIPSLLKALDDWRLFQQIIFAIPLFVLLTPL